MNEVDNHYAAQGSHEPGRPKSSYGSAPAPKGGLEGVADQAKAGVGAARKTAEDLIDKASEWGRGTYQSATQATGDARRKSAAQLGRHKRTVESFVEDNPVMVGVVGLAVGLLAGALLPGTRKENEVFGRYADEAREQGLRYARDLAEQGKHLVEEGLDNAGRVAEQQPEAGQA